MTTTQKQRRHEKSFCFRHYYKWILCFFLTLYFLASFFVDHDHDHDHDDRTTPSNSSTPDLLPNPKSNSVMASRAVIESESIGQDPNVKPGKLNGLKIYVYELPSKFNKDWLQNDRCGSHLFAAEVALHRALLGAAGVRTEDPYEADFFFVPVYVSCNFSTVNGFPAIGHARTLISDAVRLVSARFPFWNRTRGSDHVFVATHDFGSCFHTMEDRAIADGVPEILKNSIILQTFGVKYKHPCQGVEHVVIPPYISPESVRKTSNNFPATGKRDIFVFFRGKMEVNPKNISGRFYSKRVRTEIGRRYSGDRRFYLRRNRLAGYQSEIARSVFCLCPLGWAPWSPRLVESVVLGCVPVIIADGIRLPFPSAVPWPEISLTVPERHLGDLGKILEHVAASNLSVIQRNLEEPSVKRALLFNVPMEEGDATWQVLEALSEKFGRSVRRSKGFLLQ
ncbi:PREDICTED: probable glucuronoxylan glucuronosyltransferase IRX7 [Tarenaya hassleriana]|uniref:probable glucuronoxylan glucuronosyltransferase IRX7 n=1 Tax=Tarenaya hassleriana TaxID=28532 RepID=UPI00053C10E5|nr:PREDICTED: probable glucuronoxylan glucuronosyltransferase IRX7 [Tarenaya hassleriana]